MQKRMRLILLTSFALILLTLSYLHSSPYRALAVSSQNNTGQFRELIRQEIGNFFANITNRPQSPIFYKLLDHHNGGIISSALRPTTVNYAHMNAVSYLSNLKTLNSTIFLNSSFTGRNFSTIAYGMLVSPSEGFSYKITISWDALSHSWNKTIRQVTNTGLSRVVEMHRNYTNFYQGEEHPLVDFFFDLKVMGYPRQIEAVSFTNYTGYENGKILNLADYSKPVFFPEPNFPVSTSPVKVRQHNVETTELAINSLMPFRSTVSLAGNASQFFQIAIKPYYLSLNPLGANTSVIQVHPSQNAEVNTTYNMPLIMNISMPAGFGIPTYESKIQYPIITATVLKGLPEPQFIIPIPSQYLAPLYAIILSSLFGWSIPSIMGWVKARTQRKYLKECINQIGKLDRNAIEEMITGYYVDGKISESHRQLLKDKISEYYEKVKGS